MTTITRRPGVTATAGNGPRLGAIKNLFNNPRAVTSTGLASLWGTGGSGAVSLVTSGGPASNCPTFYRATWSASTNAPGTAQVINRSMESNQVTPGRKYTLKVYVRSSAALTVVPKIGWFKDTTYSASTNGAAVTLVPNQWTQLIAEGTAPAGANRLQVNTDPTNASVPIPAGATIDVTGWFSYESATGSTVGNDGAPAYADGDTTGWAWLGTPHASVSQGYGAVLS